MGSDRPLTVWDPRAARVVSRPVQHRGPGGTTEKSDQVVVEEPLEIRLGGDSLVVTMRTPGDDLELTAGFLFSEGIIDSLDDIESIHHAQDAGRDAGNIVVVTARPGRELSVAHARRVIRASAACGLCGVENIAAVKRRVATLDDDIRVPLAVISALPAAIRAAQPVFDVTGALHAVGLFRPDGSPLVVKEDVGRHNAVDKVVGHQLRAGTPSLAGTVMMFSGRAGFEIVQKAAVARVPVVCAVSAPSSLAVDLAREVGLTLVGFVRGESVNIYTHPTRIAR